MFLDLLGFIFAASSLGQMWTLLDYDKYQYMFHNNIPDGLIIIRFIGSWIQRIVGLAGGIGLMLHRRWAAQILIILSLYNIITVPWKHPLEAVTKHCILLDKYFGDILHSYSDLHFVSFASQAATLLRITDVIFFLLTIYYLSRNTIKQKLK